MPSLELIVRKMPYLIFSIRMLLQFLMIPASCFCTESLFTCSDNIIPKHGNIKTLSDVSLMQCATQSQANVIATSFVWMHKNKSCIIYNGNYNDDEEFMNVDSSSFCKLLRCRNENVQGASTADYNICLPPQYVHGVYAELYLNCGSSLYVSALKNIMKYQKKQPDKVVIFKQFQTPWTAKYDNAAYQLSAFFKAPQTGLYSFGVHSDDGCQLLLSSNEEEKNLRLILASLIGNNEGNPKLMSADIRLEKQKFYLLRGIVKERSGDDYIRVGIKFPDGSYHRIIQEEYLYYNPRWMKSTSK